MIRIRKIPITGILIATCFLCACTNDAPYYTINGETMGTYYKVTCQTKVPTAKLKLEIDSTLIAFNKVLSTYDPDSEISKINRRTVENEAVLVSPMLWENIKRSAHWYHESNGYFDPSIMPLVNYWGFGYTDKKTVELTDSLMVDSILQFVGFDHWRLDNLKKSISKSDARQELDLSAIAKGYGVDHVAQLLESHGILNFLVDIGGEMKAYGVNDKGEYWNVGINTPKIESSHSDIISVVQLQNTAIASSGNYRNYRKKNGGQVYGHTLNPHTGYPYQDRLLAVSIIADHCMDADAIATACMAMGYDRAFEFIKKHESVKACLYSGSSADTITRTYVNGFVQQLVR